MRKTIYIVLSLALFGLTSCNVDKYVQADQRILRKNDINITMADSSAVTSDIRSALSNATQYYNQKPNKKIVFVPLKRLLYCIPEPDDSTFWGNLWHKAGEPPVIYDRRAANHTAAQLTTLLKTKGSFGSKVIVDTTHRRNSFVDVTYNIVASHRKTIDEVVFRSRQQDINTLLQQWKGESLIRVGDFYDQDLLTQEQLRIVNNLKNEGYYYASQEMVHFLVDTTYDSQKMGIMVSVRVPQNAEGKQGNSTLNKYYIGDIYVYPNISTALNPSEYQFDTLVYRYKHLRGFSDINFIHNGPITPSPRTISSSLFIFSGMPYRPQISSSTSNSLLGLHNFKYVDINFFESPKSTDSLKLLDARIRLLNSSRHRVSLSFELTNASDFGFSSGQGNFFTSGNIGLGTSLGYENNNLFGGAERFNLRGGLIFDFPKKVFSSKAKSFYDVFANFEGDVTASLDLPGFLAPFMGNIIWQSFKPHTLVQLSYNYLFRSLSVPSHDNVGTNTDIQLERVRVGESFGYTWSQGHNIRHVLLPLNLSYSRLISGEEYYRHLSELTHDWQFLYQTRDFVLLNTHYEFTYTDQDISRRNNFKYYHLSVETAGNVLNGVASLIGHTPTVNSTTGKRLEFSQYFRFESEYKQYIYLGQKNTLVLRLLGGFALPYGQSSEVPYEKMFAGGGPSSMRGWSLRHLGPGQRNPDSANYIWGVAPIQLVFNIEERFPLFGIFEGAVFADMGNVWEWSTWGVNTRRNRIHGGNVSYKFDPMEILKGVALDAGIGLRAKISVITIRLDLALPIYDPNYAADERWFTNHWSWKIMALNFGINYPF